MKYIVYASNLHYGGGVQVATSTILDLSMNEDIAKDIHIFVSNKVNTNLIKTNFNSNSFYKYDIVDHYGILSIFKNESILKIKCIGLFVIFGPFYSISKPNNLIQGFANPWIVNPNNDVLKKFSLFLKTFTYFKLEIQKYFFQRSSLLFVEDQYVKNELLKIFKWENDKIKVIPNNISDIYSKPNLWQDINFNFKPFSKTIKIGFLGRNYPHKNTKVLPKVKFILNKKYQLNCDFFVTFSNIEWNKTNTIFKKNIINVGELTLLQCPIFYQNMDAIIFPSLLECFSITPIEALFMEKPLFASDRYFIKNICKNFPFYFDPNDPEDIAKSIYSYFILNNKKNDDYHLQKDFVLSYSNSNNRTLEYYNQIINYNSINP
jgi:glycosyltransferase involved in cell wall biosynthesis